MFYVYSIIDGTKTLEAGTCVEHEIANYIQRGQDLADKHGKPLTVQFTPRTTFFTVTPGSKPKTVNTLDPSHSTQTSRVFKQGESPPPIKDPSLHALENCQS